MTQISPIPLYQSALKESMPNLMVESALKIRKGSLVIGENRVPIDSKINILSFGKASILMYQAAKKIIGDEYFGKGLLVTHEDRSIGRLDANKESIVRSTHPLITKSSYVAGSEVRAFVESGSDDDILLVLISGGGSAMVASPVDSISPQDKIEFITRVMHMSVPEREVNILQKSLSKIKGGRLAELTKGKVIVNCILSDEREHELSAISSGMTVCNELIDPISVMDTYNLWNVAGVSIKNAILKHGRAYKVGCNKEIVNQVIGSRDSLIEVLTRKYVEFGFDSINVLENMHSCTPSNAAEKLIGEFDRFYNLARPGKHLLVSTGEVQVDTRQISDAKGGRNQHLTALLMLKYRPDFRFFFAAIATDGMDYLDGVHGAFYNSQTKHAIEENLDFIRSSVSKFNSHKVHSMLKTLLEGSKTGTNMSDFFLFTFEKKPYKNENENSIYCN